MDKRLLIMIAAFIVAAVAVWWVMAAFMGDAPENVATNTPRALPAAEAADPPEPVGSRFAPQSTARPRAATESRPAPMRREAAAPVREDGTAVELRVVDALTGEPVETYAAEVVDNLQIDVPNLTRTEAQLVALYLAGEAGAIEPGRRARDGGAVRLAAPADLPLLVLVRAADYAPAAEVVPALAASETRAIEVRLDPGAAATVTVANAAGEPVPKASVLLDVTGTTIAEYLETLMGPNPMLPLGITGESGEFEVLLPSHVELNLIASHQNFRQETKTIQLASAQPAEIPFVLHSPGAITGVVTANGRPVTGAMVMARPRGNAMGDAGRPGWRGFGTEANDDENRFERSRGSDRATRGPRGRFSRGASDDPAEESRRQQRDGNPRERLAPRDSGDTGEAHQRQSATGPNLGWPADAADGPATEWRRQRRDRMADADDPAAAERRRQWIEQQRAAAQAPGGNESEAPWGRRFTDDESNDRRGRGGWRGSRVETDDNGIYRIDGLDDGEYEVSVMTLDETGGFAGGQRLTRYAAVAEDMETQLDFALPILSATLTGTVTVNGQPAAMSFVRGVVRNEDGQQPFVSRVDESGRYETAVPAGEAELQIFANAPGARAAATTRLTVTIPPRSTVRQDIALTR